MNIWPVRPIGPLFFFTSFLRTHIWRVSNSPKVILELKFQTVSLSGAFEIPTKGIGGPVSLLEFPEFMFGGISNTPKVVPLR